MMDTEAVFELQESACAARELDEAFIERLSQLSMDCFGVPPWNLHADYTALLKRLTSFRGTIYFSTRGGELQGFSIGTVITRASRSYFGLAASEAARGDYFLTWRAVRENARGKGLGKLLTLARVDEARHRGAGRVLVETRARNLGTLQMYRELGFSEVRRWAVAGEGTIIEKVLMAKTISEEKVHEL